MKKQFQWQSILVIKRRELNILWLGLTIPVSVKLRMSLSLCVHVIHAEQIIVNDKNLIEKTLFGLLEYSPSVTIPAISKSVHVMLTLSQLGYNKRGSVIVFAIICVYIFIYGYHLSFLTNN